jgi:urease accessory protein
MPDGMRGYAELTFERRAAATVLTRASVHAPLKVVRPFRCPDGRLAVPLITLGPGLCGGDRCEIRVEAGAGCRVMLTTTAATRIMSMPEGVHAAQHVSLTAGTDALLEYYPGLTIPFPDSAFDQTIEVDAAPGARIGILETWAFGRAALGEYLRFRRIQSHTTVRLDGALTYADATILDPATTNVAGAAVLDRRRYLACGFWLGADLPRAPEPPSLDDPLLMAFGQAAPGHVFLRALGDDGPALDAAVRSSMSLVAEHWNLPPLDLHRFRC